MYAALSISESQAIQVVGQAMAQFTRKYRGLYNYGCILYNSCDGRRHFVWQAALEELLFLDHIQICGGCPFTFLSKVRFWGSFELVIYVFEHNRNEEIWALSYRSNKWRMHEMMNEARWILQLNSEDSAAAGRKEKITACHKTDATIKIR